MKNFLYVALILAISSSIVSCSSEPEPFELEGTYIGLMNFADSTFQQTTYSVNVTNAGGSSVLITPSTQDASTWTAILLNDDGVYTCTDCSVNQITFQWVNGAVQLDYTYQGNEQFFGAKQ